MTPKEKAKELIEKYLKLDIEIGGQYDGYLTMKMHDAKQCALTAVDELIKAFNELSIKESGAIHIDFGQGYWGQVKAEIEAL